MYESYFGFREKPFSVTPDPRFFYANPSYEEAYASLVYGIRERKGFIVLTGEVGIGKTTLLRRLMNNLEDNVRFSFLYNTNLSFEELLACICEDLGLDCRDAPRLEKIAKLNGFLIERLKAGGTVALLMDEAQNLRVDVLEELRLLSNLETSNEKLLQIILVGQPELQEKLNRSDLRQVKQRIAIRCRLNRLEQTEISDFVHSRLRAVGYEGTGLFTPEAFRSIAHYSGGLPRIINNLCDNALLICFGSGENQVSAAMIQEVARDLELDDLEKPDPLPNGPLEQAPPMEPGPVFIPDFLPDSAVHTKRHRKVGRNVFVTFLVLLLIGSLLYVANPFQIRERLPEDAARVSQIIRDLGKDLL